jgi:hypothetical protein
MREFVSVIVITYLQRVTTTAAIWPADSSIICFYSRCFSSFKLCRSSFFFFFFFFSMCACFVSLLIFLALHLIGLPVYSLLILTVLLLTSPLKSHHYPDAKHQLLDFSLYTTAVQDSKKEHRQTCVSLRVVSTAKRIDTVCCMCVCVCVCYSVLPSARVRSAYCCCRKPRPTTSHFTPLDRRLYIYVCTRLLWFFFSLFFSSF